MDEYIEDEIITNKIYARPDSAGIVVKFFSSVFQPQPAPGDILVEEGYEYHHTHVYAKYQPKDAHGRYNYRINGGVIEAIPEEDKPPLLPPAPQISLEEQITDLQLAMVELYERSNANG